MEQARPTIQGRSILTGGEKLHVRGVTYGSFRKLGDNPFPEPRQIEMDLDAMAESGLNAFRTYHVPPRRLLDLAAERGLRVLVGVPWEQHVAFLDDRSRAASIASRFRRAVSDCAGHPAVLAYAVGNEIPAPIVRWHGKRRVERFLERLYDTGKSEDPDGLFTYVNYPTTEYLELPFFDLVSFNVFLEKEQAFESYLARLQNLAGNRPLLVTEAGLDSRRHGQSFQADTLRWQIRHSFATGAAGVFVFSWTDEWHRGGADVLDWDFGVVDRVRQPKAALEAVVGAFEETPFPQDGRWPFISVVICTHNGERTLPHCLERLSALDYPNYEVIVVSDGSTDGTDLIASENGARLVATDHLGLSAARNAGTRHASGEIIAFLDDDAYPDPDWLRYLAAAFDTSSHAAIGGPNIPPADESLVAQAVAAAPGAPIHVLTSDREAEHIPGCNMAFRRDDLEALGGFDEQFRVAGDDVDICWRLQDSGRTVGFSAGAVVMHRRRDSVRRYLRQQFDYGKAEALLEAKWPNRYTQAGYPRWSGRIYGGIAAVARRRVRVNYGTWGSGLFQSIYQPAPSLWSSLPLMPESYLLLGFLAAISALGLLWSPLLIVLPGLIALVVFIAFRSITSSWRAHRRVAVESPVAALEKRVLTALMFVLQPLARLLGRLRRGLSPWRRRGLATPVSLRPRVLELWSEVWQPPEARLKQVESHLLDQGGAVRRGGAYDRWDFHIRVGMAGAARCRSVVEEHGSGRQLLRARVWPWVSAGSVLALSMSVALLGLALADGSTSAAAVLTGVALLGLVAVVRDCRGAMGVAMLALQNYSHNPETITLRGSDSDSRGPLDALEEEVAGHGDRLPSDSPVRGEAAGSRQGRLEGLRGASPPMQTLSFEEKRETPS